MGFAEKVRFAGDKRVYMAEQFYDISREVIRHYHSKFIRHSVNTFDGNNGVVHSIGLEYTGPLFFMNFWLEEVSACDHHQLVALSATKDVQDAVLKDDSHAPMVDVIDIRQWHYRADGTTYEPLGGESLAPRQHARLIPKGEASCASVYRAVYEYRKAYPQKAVVYNSLLPRAPQNAANWAVFMAGGSFAKVPPVDGVPFYELASTMLPLENQTVMDEQWVMGASGKGYIVCSMNGVVKLDLTGDKRKYKMAWIHPVTGELIQAKGLTKRVAGGSLCEWKAPEGFAVCLLY